MAAEAEVAPHPAFPLHPNHLLAAHRAAAEAAGAGESEAEEMALLGSKQARSSSLLLIQMHRSFQLGAGVVVPRLWQQQVSDVQQP